MHLLLVEDDEMIGDLFAEVFASDWAMGVIRVRSGPEALAQLASSQTPDAAVIDLLLPGMSGFEIAADAAKRGVPSLLMTGSFEQAAVCDEMQFPYIRKPFSLDALKIRLDALIARRQGSVRQLREASERLALTRARSRQLVAQSERLQIEAIEAIEARRGHPRGRR